MKLTITIAVIIIMVICNIFYLRWAGSSKGHNFDGKQLIKSQRMARIMLAIALDMAIAGWLLFWNAVISDLIFLIVLLIAVLMVNLL